MSKARTDWRDVFQYDAAKQGAEGEGYWIFAPFLEGEVELFQLSCLLFAGGLRELRTTVVTPDGACNFTLPRDASEADKKIIYGADQFQLGFGPNVTLSSEAPDRAYRIQTWDPKNEVRTDLEIRPATKLLWTIPGSHYITTLDSVLEGTITIKGADHKVSTLCAFEHSSWGKPSLGVNKMPPFWHYEYIQWNDGQKPFGSFLWNILNDADEQLQSAGFHTAYPGRGDVASYDSYEVTYKNVEECGGVAMPQAWEVKATRGSESFHYRVKVRTVLHAAHGMFCDVLFDAHGIYHGPNGDIPIHGRGRTEYICSSYNPAKPKTA